MSQHMMRNHSNIATSNTSNTTSNDDHTLGIIRPKAKNSLSSGSSSSAYAIAKRMDDGENDGKNKEQGKELEYVKRNTNHDAGVIEDEFTRQEELELERVHHSAHSLYELAHSVSNLVNDSNEHVEQLETNVASTQDNLLAGLTELSIAKKREAGKHTTRGTMVTATIGGVVGIIGGPIGIAVGASAGAALGGLIGSGFTALSRSSIEREIRLFKQKYQSKFHRDGSISYYAEAYENQRWVFGDWSSNNLLITDPVVPWSDIDGVNVLACPLRPNVGPSSPKFSDEDRAEHPEAVAQSDGKFYAIETQDDEIMIDNGWRWVESWRIDLGNFNADPQGWEYAFNFRPSSVWVKECSSTCFVRRRRWIRGQKFYPALKQQQQLDQQHLRGIENDNNRKSNAGSIKRKESSRSERANQLIDQSTSRMVQTLNTTSNTLGVVQMQGEQFDRSLENLRRIEEAAARAERVRRAVDIGGALANFGSSVQIDPKLKTTSTAPPPRPSSELLTNSQTPIGEEDEYDSLDRLSKIVDQNSNASRTLLKTVDIQNEQLDIIQDATFRGSDRVRLLNRRM